MSSTVSVTRSDNIAVVTIDNPPVNALGYNLRKPLHDALGELRDDPTAEAIVVTCAGRTFIAGADITEFGKPMQAPSLPDLIEMLESIGKPTVAAIHGTALGGGLELALGCHFRVADAGAKLGLPEVKLGLLPGAGGTQRLPRIVGPEKAVRMVVSGNPIAAAEAHADGLVDAVCSEELADNAVALAKDKVASGAALVHVRERDQKLAEARNDLAALDAVIADATKKARGLEAPLICAQSVRNAVTLPFEEGLAAEREFFIKLVTGEQSAAQRHLFFAERQAAKVDGVGKDLKRRQIRKVAVIGAGTMGGGIAMSFVNGGIPVTVLEMNQEALDRGFATISKNYDISVSRGSLSEEAKAKRLGLLTGVTSYEDLADADLIIEAVFEEMAVKKNVFGKLDAVAKPGAILASNTSYLDVDEIAASTKRPGDVVGTHFFSPANVMRLLEIVRGKQTSADVLATLLGIARVIRKVPVVVGVCHGFVGNRMLSARSAEAEDLLLEGALPQDVDKALTDFGFPMGQYAMADLAGLDIGWRTRKSLGTTAAIADSLCEEGRYGQKTGKGYYLYKDGSRKPEADPEVETLIEKVSAGRNLARRKISAEEIIERTLYPMVNEGARILEEGIAARSSDIDIVWANGYGFPIGKGGPMFWADSVGLGKIVERLEHWHGEMGKDVYKPAKLLKDLAASGKSFTAGT